MPAQTSVIGARDIRYAESVRAKTLRQYHRALADSDTNPVNILCIGDSITEGGNAITRDTRWVGVMRDRIRTRWQPAGITGGEGYIAPFYVSTTMPDAFTSVGATQDFNYGLGRRAHVLADAADQMSITVTATGIDIFWAGGPSTDVFSWSIDGGAATNVDTTLGTALDGNVTQIRGLSAAAHSLVIARVSGTAVIDGIMVYNGDEAKGIRVWESGFGGAESDFFATAVPWRDLLTLINPALVVISQGINDFITCATNPIYTPAYFRANTEETISWVRAKVSGSDPSIVLIVEPKPYNPSTYPFEEYIAQLYAIARADGNIGICDMHERFGLNPLVAGVDLVYGDGVHPTTLGHRFWGNAVAGYLEP